MLSQHDRHALAVIEQRLRESDPEFAHRLEHMSLRRSRARRLLPWLIVMAGLALEPALLATAITLRSMNLAVAAVIVLGIATVSAVLGAVASFRQPKASGAQGRRRAP